MMRREIAQEYPPADEEKTIDAFITLIKSHMTKTFPTGTMKRGAHPKAHGCVQAEFIIESNLPENLRVGVFREAKTYQAWIRFSNAGDPKADATPDLRGMAIKLMDVNGEQNPGGSHRMQDFLLVSHPVFMTRDVEDFFRFNRAFEEGWLLWYFFNPFRFKLQTFNILRAMARTMSNVLALKYWSITPSLFGEGCAVKYAAFPVTSVSDQMPENPDENFLHDALKQTLTQQEVVFDFFVQFQVDADKMPVEDAMVLWDEKLSPHCKVATIRIPKQNFDSPEQEQFCENLSFSPWNGLVEHRPLGGLNRARKRMYKVLSQFRYEKNGTSKEPRIE
jgi:hypothetical protein